MHLILMRSHPHHASLSLEERGEKEIEKLKRK